MFKGFKILVGGSKDDCCTITIQEVKESTEVSKNCCEAKVETEETCCN